MRFEDLANADVAIWGYGREGRSVLAAFRGRFPQQSLTLYCKADEAEVARKRGDERLNVIAAPPEAAMLSAHDVVIKSPGISAYKSEIIAAQARGARFTSGTALWFGANPESRVVAVTGTKGKSTTTALIAHCARTLGVRTALAGNIGLPLLELRDQSADLWAIELSSFQTGEAGPLELGVVTSLYEEHLDWHGSRERYVADKLKLADAARSLLVNATQPALLERVQRHPRLLRFGHAAGWHVADGHIRRGAQAVFPLAGMAAPAEH